MALRLLVLLVGALLLLVATPMASAQPCGGTIDLNCEWELGDECLVYARVGQPWLYSACVPQQASADGATAAGA